MSPQAPQHCPVCQEQGGDPAAFVTFPCGHAIHVRCCVEHALHVGAAAAASASSVNYRCPMCRAVVAGAELESPEAAALPLGPPGALDVGHGIIVIERPGGGFAVLRHAGALQVAQRGPDPEARAGGGEDSRAFAVFSRIACAAFLVWMLILWYRASAALTPRGHGGD